MIETFRYIEYSDKNKFEISSSGKIQLKGYPSSLLLYSSFDSILNADYSVGDKNAINGDTTLIDNFGVFGQYLKIINNGYVQYNKNNFETLTNEGSIKFRLKTGFNNNPGYQDFKAITVSAGDTNYSFKLLVDGDSQDVNVLLTSGDTMLNVANKIDTALTSADASVLLAGNIRIIAQNNGDSISILSPVSGNDIITLLGGVYSSELPNAPTTDTALIDFFKTGDTDRIKIVHKTDGHLHLWMNDKNGDTQINQDIGVWNNSYTNWYSFEFNWNDSIYQFFINGTQKYVGTTEFLRSSGGYLKIASTSGNTYRIDELIIYNEYQNSKSYTVETSALSQYANDDPYIDIHFGTGFKENEISDLNLTASNNCKFVVKPSNAWYYYIAGAWRVSDGTLNQSIDPGIMETQFSNLLFDENKDLIIRAYFHSDGSTQSFIDEINIVKSIGAAEAAIITGTVSISSTIDLTTNHNIVITTDKGNKQINLSTGVGDTTAVSLNEIQSAIDSASVLGLAPATDDGNYHLVLQSTSTGDSAYVAISNGLTNDALSLIWGYEATDSGIAATGTVIDYTELFRYTRSMLGSPTVPVEITDEQLEDGLVEVLYAYNRWRNYDESLAYITLNGDGKNGYDIPAIIGGKENIIEMIISPRYPFTYYAGRTDLVTNLYIQYMFNRYKSGFSNVLTDYYITMSTEQDINIVLGTQTKWEILNNKLFIFPQPTELNVGIRYRSAISVEEINNNVWIRKLIVAKAKIILGNIRNTFKNGIPGGSENIQLNGADLIAEGQQEWALIVADMKLSTEPLFLEFF